MKKSPRKRRKKIELNEKLEDEKLAHEEAQKNELENKMEGEKIEKVERMEMMNKKMEDGNNGKEKAECERKKSEDVAKLAEEVEADKAAGAINEVAKVKAGKAEKMAREAKKAEAAARDAEEKQKAVEELRAEEESLKAEHAAAEAAQAAELAAAERQAIIYKSWLVRKPQLVRIGRHNPADLQRLIAYYEGNGDGVNQPDGILYKAEMSDMEEDERRAAEEGNRNEDDVQQEADKQATLKARSTKDAATDESGKECKAADMKQTHTKVCSEIVSMDAVESEADDAAKKGAINGVVRGKPSVTVKQSENVHEEPDFQQEKNSQAEQIVHEAQNIQKELYIQEEQDAECTIGYHISPTESRDVDGEATTTEDSDEEDPSDIDKESGDENREPDELPPSTQIPSDPIFQSARKALDPIVQLIESQPRPLSLLQLAADADLSYVDIGGRTGTTENV